MEVIWSIIEMQFYVFVIHLNALSSIGHMGLGLYAGHTHV